MHFFYHMSNLRSILTLAGLTWLKKILILIISCFLFMLIVGCDDASNISKAFKNRDAMTREEAIQELFQLTENIDFRRSIETGRAKLDLEMEEPDLAKNLPPIEEFPIINTAVTTQNSVVVEIFSSSEKSGTGTDGWLVEIAEEFNKSSIKIDGGKTAQVLIRKIPSGIGYQFISSNTYEPDAFTPSNELWIKLAEYSGKNFKVISESLVGNEAGLVLKNNLVEDFMKDDGIIDYGEVIEKVVTGQIVMGYTNPFASSTGLNFLVTVLNHFGGTNTENLTDDVISVFREFQKSVPFVAMTTLQLRNGVEKSGSLDVLVMEKQTYLQVPSLVNGFTFVPFGSYHNNPLVALANINAPKIEVLEIFKSFSEKSKFKVKAKEYGFNNPTKSFKTLAVPSGDFIKKAQRVWKFEKDSGKQIVTLFLCDVSGSMTGARLANVKEALKLGSEFINKKHQAGIISFNSEVQLKLPISDFAINHKAGFIEVANNLEAGGGTAMYDGIAVSLKLLLEKINQDNNLKPMLFVLTDGETKSGLKYNDLESIIEKIGIPIYTIGFEANIPELKMLSNTVEASTIDANVDNIKYKIGSLFNAQM